MKKSIYFFLAYKELPCYYLYLSITVLWFWQYFFVMEGPKTLLCAIVF